jgi:hypothetical protein
MKYLIISVALLSLLWTGCDLTPKEPEPTLPLATREGKNTLGCYVNGVLHSYSEQLGNGLFADKGVDFGDPIASYGYFEIKGVSPNQPGDVYILVETDTVKADSVYTDLYPPFYPTTYSKGYGEYTVKPYDLFNQVFLTRFDNQVAAGFFSFRAYTSDGTDSVYVTYGRFDIAR